MGALNSFLRMRLPIRPVPPKTTILGRAGGVIGLGRVGCTNVGESRSDSGVMYSVHRCCGCWFVVVGCCCCVLEGSGE